MLREYYQRVFSDYVDMGFRKFKLDIAYGKILNLDHLGTNTPVPKEEDYLEHTKLLLSLEGGYPCVSLLPDFFGERTADMFTDSIWEWQNNSRR